MEATPERSPEASSQAAAADGYEARYMDGGRSLLRERMSVPAWFHAVMLVCGLGPLGLLATGAYPAAIASVIVLFTWLLFAYLRVTLTTTHLHVQFGLFGPKIPVQGIRTIEVRRKDDFVPFGFGNKYLGDGVWAYAMPTSKGQGIYVEYADAADKIRKAFVSSERADEITAMIQKLRAGAGNPVRVAVDPTEPARETDVVGSNERASAGEEPARRTPG